LAGRLARRSDRIVMPRSDGAVLRDELGGG
jgi:hypothetical protein